MKILRFLALPVCQIAASYGAEAIFFYGLFDTKLHPDQDRIMAAVLLTLTAANIWNAWRTCRKGGGSRPLFQGALLIKYSLIPLYVVNFVIGALIVGGMTVIGTVIPIFGPFMFLFALVFPLFFLSWCMFTGMMSGLAGLVIVFPAILLSLLSLCAGSAYSIAGMIEVRKQGGLKKWQAVLLILSQCFYVTDVAVLAGYSFWHRIWRRGTVAVILLPVVLTAAAIVWAVVWFLT